MDIIGIDVGGTNTDATLIRGGRVVAMAKTPTQHDDLLASTRQVLQQIMEYHTGNEPIQLHLSTTLSTNAIVEGKGEPTAVLAVPGPGINLDTLELGFPLHQLSGYIDHRGREVASIDTEEVLQAARKAKAAGAQALAVTGKFSHRNPVQEKLIHSIITKDGLEFSSITLGHRLSGRANFPRRLATAYLNAAVAQQQLHFVTMIENLLQTDTDIAQVLVLKADGGTMRLRDSAVRPVETILSGPAASIMAAKPLPIPRGKYRRGGYRGRLPISRSSWLVKPYSNGTEPKSPAIALWCQPYTAAPSDSVATAQFTPAAMVRANSV